MTDDLIKRARDALDGVTPGPWSAGKTHPHKISRGGEYIANADPIHRKQPICDANARFIAAARDLVPAMADRIEALEAEMAQLWADRDSQDAAWCARVQALTAALDAQPGFTADDLRRAWELCRDAVANEIDCGGCAHCMDPTNCWRDAANDVRAMTPPADLADKVKEGRDNG